MNREGTRFLVYFHVDKVLPLVGDKTDGKVETLDKEGHGPGI